MLDRHGLVERRSRVRRRAQGTALSVGQRPNELWCTDYKGEFLLANRQYCYPLTVTDHASCFLVTCEAFSSEDYAFTGFERLFNERGLPAQWSCSFSPSGLTPGSGSVNSALTIKTTHANGTSGTPPGTYPIAITGKSDPLVHSATVTLVVN